MTAALDIQYGGKHYRGLKIQPVEFIMANMMGFCEGCVVKYVTRWRTKGGIEDLKKARHFIQFLLEAPLYIRVLSRIRGAIQGSSWWYDALNANQYIEANNIQNPEAGVIRHISWFNSSGSRGDLEGAMKWMDELIESAEDEGFVPGVKVSMTYHQALAAVDNFDSEYIGQESGPLWQWAVEESMNGGEL